MKHRAISHTLILLALFATSTGAEAAYIHRWTIFPEHSGLRVLTSVPQLADVAKKIGGRRIAVVSLLKPSVDFHNPKLVGSMVKATEEADVLLRLNPSLDSWIEELTRQSNNQRLRPESGCFRACLEQTSVKNSRSLDLLLNDERTARSVAQDVLGVLIHADPKNESYYRANSEAYLRTLQKSPKQQTSSSRKDP